MPVDLYLYFTQAQVYAAAALLAHDATHRGVYWLSALIHALLAAGKLLHA